MSVSASNNSGVEQEFQHFWLVLKRRWLPAISVFGVAMGCAIAAAYLQKPSFQADGTLLFKTNRTPSLTGVGKALENASSLATQSNPMNARKAVVGSIPLVQKTIDALKLTDNDGDPLTVSEFIDKNLQIKVVPASDVITLQYKSKNPQEAAAVLNKLMELYIQHSIFENRAETTVASQFVNQQLPEAQAVLRRTEAAIRRFKERYQVISIDKEKDLTALAIADLTNQITQIRQQLSAAEAQSTALQRQIGLNPQQATVVVELSQSQGVQKALKELQDIESQLTVERTRFQDNSPLIIDIKERKASLEALLKQRAGQTLNTNHSFQDRAFQAGKLKQEFISSLLKAEVKRSDLASQLTTLIKARNNYQNRAEQLPRLEQESFELQRQQEAAQLAYQGLLKSAQDLRLAENQVIGDAIILEPALVPDKPSVLKPLLTIALGFLLGSFGSLATIVALELQDNSLKTLQELRNLFGYPLVGLIPAFLPKASLQRRSSELEIPELLVKDLPSSMISESYRMLQANLKFSSSEQLKVITITSSVPQEGKSTTASNLAAAIAQLGNRVLLIDADLHHPMLHHIWGLNNIAGLSHLLIGEATIEAAHPVSVGESSHVDVLTAGAVPPNPLALLESKRMEAFITSVAESYDYVLIDAPPLVVAADALTLGKLSDGVLVVARPGIITAAAAQAGKEALERSSQNILGLVVNGVIVEDEPDSYFHFTKQYYRDAKGSTKVDSTKVKATVTTQ